MTAHDYATALFAVCLPCVVPYAMLVGFVWIAWFNDMRDVLERVRDRHAGFWIEEGRPWWSYMGPSPTRSPQERGAGRAATRPWPSHGWMFRFAWRRLPAPLTGDADLVRMHRRVSFVLPVAIACSLPLVPYVALGAWVLYFS